MPGNADTVHPEFYCGRYDRGVDQSRRILLPAEWRGEGRSIDFTILAWPMQGPSYLLVLPPQRWALMRQNLGNISLTNEAAAKAERFISVNSFPRSLDTYGRLPIPDAAAKAVGIEGEAALVGRLDKFEIWDPRRLDANLSDPETRKVLASLSTLHL
jgi:MraZ protein